jgi:peptidoglycan/LPS O-acetylase OafA/YrhL
LKTGRNISRNVTNAPTKFSLGQELAFVSLPQVLNSLTSLRFFAAAIVVVHHTLPGWSHYSLTYRVAQFGDLGVTFFFILSGFVLTWAQQSAKKTQDIYVFLRLRFARIYPLHFVFLIVTAVAYLGFKLTLAGYPNASTLTIFSQLFLVHGWIPFHPQIRQGLNGVSWTLSLEFFFYLMTIPIYRILQAKSNKALIAICISLYSAYGILVWITTFNHSLKMDSLIWYYPPFRLPEFIYGMTLAILIQREREKSKIIPTWISLTAAAAAITLYSELVTNKNRFSSQYNFLMIPFFLFIIWSFARKDMLGRKGFMSGKVLVLLGEESYALYISHAVLLGIYTYALHNLGGNIQNSRAGDLITICFVMCAMTLARLLHTIIEIPCQKFLKKKWHLAGPS